MSTEILSSTGDLGLDFRVNGERLYWNSPLGIIDDSRFVERQARRAQAAVDQGIASRVVGRLVMSYDAFRDSYLGSNIVQKGLEAAFEFDESLVMAMFGFNSPSRHPIIPVECMVDDTQGLETGESPVDRVVGLRQQGIVFHDRIEPQFFRDLIELWGPTFGWNETQIMNLQNRLALQEHINPSRYSVWFSAATYEGQVISLATAERLDMPLVPKLDRHMQIIESTEWRTRPGWGSRGIMAATASYLNAQIIRARRGSSESYRIIAETNYFSQAYRVGAAIGMQVPAREPGGGIFVPQVLRQNVEVHDGLEPTGLRDFIFMELPVSVINREYSDAAVRDILRRDI